MFDVLYRGLRTQFLTGALNLENFYRGLYTRVVLTLLFVGLSALYLNATGDKGVNIALIIPTVLIIVYFGLQPSYLLGIAVAAKMVRFKATKALDTWEKFWKQAALFMVIFLLTLGIIPIRESIEAAFTIIGGLVAIGLLVWAFKKEAKYYQKYIVCLALTAIVIGAIGLMSPAQRINIFGFNPLKMFSVKPQQDVARRILDEDTARRDAEEAKQISESRGKSLSPEERAKVRQVAHGQGTLPDQARKIAVGDVVPYTLTSLSAPQPLCGYDPDKLYVYTITGDTALYVQHETGYTNTQNPHRLTGSSVAPEGPLPIGGVDKQWALGLNGMLPGETVRPDEKGCFKVELNLDETKKRTWKIFGGKQVVHIRLQTGIIASVRKLVD